MTAMLRIASLAVLTIVFACLIQAQNTSGYTSLRSKDCHKLRLKDGDILLREQCKGFAGFKLDHLANEDIDWIELITPGGKRFKLGTQFNMPGYLASSVEWRLKNGQPVALIARYTLVKPDNMKKISTILISKVSATSACVTDVIDLSGKRGIPMRSLADSAALRPCWPTYRDQEQK
jgi:hypothetical protein